jgi:hypothetical protein
MTPAFMYVYINIIHSVLSAVPPNVVFMIVIIIINTATALYTILL